jgi:hypothetical protein
MIVPLALANIDRMLPLFRSCRLVEPSVPTSFSP